MAATMLPQVQALDENEVNTFEHIPSRIHTP